MQKNSKNHKIPRGKKKSLGLDLSPLNVITELLQNYNPVCAFLNLLLYS